MAQTSLFYRFGAALAIGFLIGLQREYAHGDPEEEIFAGVRTFALIGLLGCVAALAAEQLSFPWTFIGVFVLMSVLVIIAYLFNVRRGEIGLTSEISALLTFLVGALCYWDNLPLAAAIAVAATVLLALKPETHTFARRISREDMYATLKFTVITAIVLPVLPNRTFGPPPLDVLNPYKVWLMVVFISGITFLGYVLVKIVGPRQGIGLTGVLGGLVSSTPLTLSFTQRSQEEPSLGRPFALAIMVAWALMFPRVMVEVAALNPAVLETLWLPMAAATAVGLAYSLYLYESQSADTEEEVSFSNPFELAPALKFGLIYAAVLLVSRAGQVYLGNTGLYLSSIISGLADADAITLSVTELTTGSGGLDVGTASRAIVLGAMSNTVAKGVIVLATGSSTLRKAILPGLLLILVVGVGMAFIP